MTGPEAYRRALELATAAAQRPSTDEGRTLAILSGTYAKLAQVAAAVDATGPEMKSATEAAWRRAISPQPRDRRTRHETGEGGEPS